MEAAERSVLLSGTESSIWFTYIVAGWQARARYDLACSLAWIYCTSSFYVRFKGGSVRHLGSFFFFSFFFRLNLTSVILMPYIPCPFTASPFVYFGSLYHRLELFMNSIKRDRCGRLFCSSCLGLGFLSDRGFQHHLHMWLRISGTSRSAETKQLSRCSTGKIFYGFSKDVCECARRGRNVANVIKAAGDSLSEWKWFHQQQGLLQLHSVLRRDGLKSNQLAFKACIFVLMKHRAGEWCV